MTCNRVSHCIKNIFIFYHKIMLPSLDMLKYLACCILNSGSDHSMNTCRSEPTTARLNVPIINSLNNILFRKNTIKQ